MLWSGREFGWPSGLGDSLRALAVYRRWTTSTRWRRLGWRQEVDRTWDAEATAIQDMGVGGADVVVAEELLHPSDVVATLEKTRGKGVPQGMTRGLLGDAAGQVGPMLLLDDAQVLL